MVLWFRCFFRGRNRLSLVSGKNIKEVFPVFASLYPCCNPVSSVACCWAQNSLCVRVSDVSTCKGLTGSLLLIAILPTEIFLAHFLSLPTPVSRPRRLFQSLHFLSSPSQCSLPGRSFQSLHSPFSIPFKSFQFFSQFSSS